MKSTGKSGDEVYGEKTKLCCHVFDNFFENVVATFLL